jgi:HSP20 family molecular chaperone IbpA
MALVRFQPFVDDFQTLQERFTGLFRIRLSPTSAGRKEWALDPLCDIYEEGDNIVVKAELPAWIGMTSTFRSRTTFSRCAARESERRK